jgi:rSAM/selenodomain-associated transferase 2
MLSAVIPTLDEAALLPALLAALRPQVDEIVVVDGGSRDGTAALAHEAGARVVTTRPGRAHQLDTGAAAARGDRLWFVHADTLLPEAAGRALRAAAPRWGCFAVRIASDDVRLRFSGAWMTARARLTGSCTGDMAIWCDRALFERLGGFATPAAFEDLDFADRARSAEPWAVLDPAVTTSARRWERNGVGRTIVSLWALRLGHRLGLDPERLARARAEAS